MPSEMFTKDFSKKLFAGDKKLMKLTAVNLINVPKYDEISVKNLYSQLIVLNEMKPYFPDKYNKGRQCERDYMFNIANSLHPTIIKEVVEHA